MSYYLFDSRGFLAQGPSIEGLRELRPLLTESAGMELINQGSTTRLVELSNELSRIAPQENPAIAKSLDELRNAVEDASDVLILTDGVGQEALQNA